MASSSFSSAHWDSLEVSTDDENSSNDEGMVCVQAPCEPVGSIYSQQELRTGVPWREQEAAVALLLPHVQPDMQPDVQPDVPARHVVAKQPPKAPQLQQQELLPDREPRLTAEMSQGLPLNALRIKCGDLSRNGAARSLDVVSQRERLRQPCYTFEQAIGNLRQPTFTGQVEWTVAGVDILVFGPAMQSKKHAKIGAAESLLIECQHRGLLALIDDDDGESTLPPRNM